MHYTHFVIQGFFLAECWVSNEEWSVWGWRCYLAKGSTYILPCSAVRYFWWIWRDRSLGLFIWPFSILSTIFYAFNFYFSVYNVTGRGTSMTKKYKKVKYFCIISKVWFYFLKGLLIKICIIIWEIDSIWQMIWLVSIRRDVKSN